MRVVVIGASGTIGAAVVAALEGRHEVVKVAHSRAEHRIEIASADTIRKLYDEIGPFDALACAAGLATFKPLAELTDEDFRLGLESKLMGQINLVRLGLPHARDGGSFTLISGTLAVEPAPGSAAISPPNVGVEAFARAAALEMPRRIRINVVRPPWVSETLAAMGRDPSGGMPAAKVATAYVSAIEGRMTGKVLDAREYA
jgi:NAD(P)-dependent dehydrogenase (short-subunit alcohol dehydrogenase family)